MTIPADLNGIDVAWANEALAERRGDASVEAVDVVNIGEGTGVFGEIAMATFTYDRDTDAPTSGVVKLPCVEPENLAVAHALGLYERELRFYEDIAPTTPLRIPERYYADRSDDGRFVLLLENMSAGYRVGDQVVGATTAEALAIVDALAPLHVAWWESPRLGALDWLPVPNAPAYMGAVPDIYRQGLPVLEADWADKVTPGSVDVARRLDPKFEALMHRTAEGPVTFAHSDTRLDNIFFPVSPADGVAFIDFQLVLRQRGAADIAYLVGTSMQIDAARNDWEPVLRRWHQHLVEGGISYSWDDCVQHYHEAALYYLCGAMSLIGSFDTGNERGAQLTHAYTTRVFDHAVTIGADQVLDTL